jgi:predicted dehydrogenase
MTDKPRIGVVGTGWWATQYHIPSLRDHDGAELAALADSNPEALQRATSVFDVPASYVDPMELYHSGLVDAVIIAVPHRDHYKQARAALDAGLHVLVEKPMTLRSEDAFDLVDRAEAAGLRLTVGLTYQHTRAAQRLHAAVQHGEIGEIMLVSGLYASMVEEYYRGRPENYRNIFNFPVTAPDASTYSDPAISGGGHGQTQVTHAMGMVRYVTGKRVDSVSAVMSNEGLQVDLVNAMSFSFTGGGIGTMAATGSIQPGQNSQQELRYYGTRGYALQDLLQGTLSIHHNNGRVDHLDPLTADEIYPAEAPARRFANLVADPEAAGPAADTVAFLEAAYESARLDGSRVPVKQP